MEPDIILCDIIATDMSLDASRVVVYDQNFKAPSDPEIYVIVRKNPSRVIGSSRTFDPDTDEEIKSIALNETYDVEITSKNRTAQDRYHEVIMALTSVYSQQQQEEHNIRIFRTREIQDLSLIEGASALHRYLIPVIIDRVETKRTTITPYESFQTPQEVFNGGT